MTVTPIPGVLYSADVARGNWFAPGRSPLPFNPTPPPDPGATGWPFDEDEPWQLQPGETLLDQMPPGVPIVQARDFAGRGADGTYDLVALLNDIEARATGPSYVQLEPGTRHIVHTLRNFGSTLAPNYLGFANSRRRVMGLIGAGVQAGTTIELSPTMVSSTPGARAYALDPRQGDTSKPWVPVAITALYISNSGTDVPFYFTGLDCRGTLQEPFGVYSTDAQSKFRRNHGVASPLPCNGLSMWRGIDGARFQHSRLSGFGFALNNAPPYEKGAIDSNYGYEIYRRLEIDGRIHADLDPAQPLASGGLMWNKDLRVRFEDSRMHHTRRSGWATNTNTKDTSELYAGRRVRIDHVASPADGWAGDNGGFSASNVEEVVGTFNYDDVWLNTEQSNQHHIVLAIPYGAGGNASNPIVLPDRPIIVVYGGFRSDDAIYGGCLRIRVIDRPNSTGISPAWQHLVNQGIAGSGLFDITNRLGEPMTGIRHTAYNPAVHKPDTHFVVTY